MYIYIVLLYFIFCFTSTSSFSHWQLPLLIFINLCSILCKPNYNRVNLHHHHSRKCFAGSPTRVVNLHHHHSRKCFAGSPTRVPAHHLVLIVQMPTRVELGCESQGLDQFTLAQGSPDFRYMYYFSLVLWLSFVCAIKKKKTILRSMKLEHKVSTYKISKLVRTTFDRYDESTSVSKSWQETVFFFNVCTSQGVATRVLVGIAYVPSTPRFAKIPLLPSL